MVTAKDIEVDVEIKLKNPKNETILQKAERIVMGDREKMYGHPKDNHECTANLWTTYLHRRHQVYSDRTNAPAYFLKPEDVCILNILQKISRCANSITKDSLADIAGWAYCVERIMDSQNGVSVSISGGASGGSASSIKDHGGSE